MKGKENYCNLFIYFLLRFSKVYFQNKSLQVGLLRRSGFPVKTFGYGRQTNFASTPAQ